MALNNVLIALACSVAFPVAALAQSPMQNVAAKADCCSADDGTAAAAAVLLPPMAVVPDAACCQTGATPAVAVDHSAHQMAPPAKAAGPGASSMAGITCCGHDAGKAGTPAPGITDGCGMGCCGGVPPPKP